MLATTSRHWPTSPDVAEHITVERSRSIAARPEQLLPHLVDLRAWRDWSPWEGMDPQLQREYSGPSSGIGATYSWSGNRQAGAGSMTIRDVTDSSVNIDVNFTKPFSSKSLSTFSLQPEQDSTTVTWQMLMPQTLLMRVFGVFFQFEKAIGSDLEKGLDGLARVVA